MPINAIGSIPGIYRSADKRIAVETDKGWIAAEELGIDPATVSVPTRFTFDGRMQVKTERGFVMADDMGVVLGAATQGQSYDEALARTNNAKRARLIYNYLPRIAPFGRQAPAGGIYYDSNYAGSDSDGTIDRPFKSIEGIDFKTPGQFVNLKRGSVFFITTERYQTCTISAPNVTFRSYGDERLPPPLITGLREVTGFTLASGEYSANFPLALGQNCMAITYGDNLGGVMVLSTAGTLTAGQAAWSANKVYLKDNPGARKIYASAAGNALLVKASGFRMDGVHVGYTSNNAIGLYPTAGTISGIMMRDCATLWGGNNGISGVDTIEVILIRHRDEGSYNNAISGIGDDSYWYVIEPVCTGRTRKANELIVGKTFGGYYNDGVTAHGTGLGPWFVVGGVITNVRENAVDIIGGPSAGNMDVHKGSITRFNRIHMCGESGILYWAYGSKVLSNHITDCGQDGIRMGDGNQKGMSMDQEVAYNFIKGCAYDGVTAFASGVGVVWGGVWVHHNTIVITAASTRTATGNLDVSGLPNLRYEENFIVLERDGIGAIQTTSFTVTKAKYSFAGNVFVLPSGNVTLPFVTGGNPRTFAQWLADVEASARSFVDTVAAGVSGATYAPNIDSPLATSLAFSAPGVDLNARYASGCVGASAVAETA